MAKKFSGYVERGGSKALTNVVGTRGEFQQSFPGATVTVYDAGTSTLSTIYQEDGVTPKANPFTADDTAYWEFYASADNSYDLQFSGLGIAIPWTLEDVTGVLEPADVILRSGGSQPLKADLDVGNENILSLNSASRINVRQYAVTAAQRAAMGQGLTGYNGGFAKLSDFYATLAEAQADYPDATDLDWSLDQAVIQKAATNAELGEVTYFPFGSAFVVDQIKIRSGRVNWVGDHREYSPFVRRADATADFMIGPADESYATSGTLSGKLHQVQMQYIAFNGNNVAGDILRIGDPYWTASSGGTGGNVTAGSEPMLRRLRIENATKGTVYNTGLVATATQGSKTITFDASAVVDASWVGRYIDIVNATDDHFRSRIASVTTAGAGGEIEMTNGYAPANGTNLSFEIHRGGHALLFRPSIGYAEYIWITKSDTGFSIHGSSCQGFGLEASLINDGGTALRIHDRGHRIFGWHHEEAGATTVQSVWVQNAQGNSLYGVNLNVTDAATTFNGIKVTTHGTNAANNNIFDGLLFRTSAGGGYNTTINDKYSDFSESNVLRTRYVVGHADRAIKSFSTNYNATDYTGITTFRWIGSVDRTLTLPNLIKPSLRQITAINDGTSTFTISKNGSDATGTLLGADSITLQPGDSITLESDGTRWLLVSFENKDRAVNGNIVLPGTITERGRATALGEWIDVAHDAADFIHPVGGETWTVESGDLETFAYTLVGKTMTVAFTINTSSVSASVGTLRIQIPGGFTAAETVWSAGACINAGTNEGMRINTTAASGFITIKRISGASWGAATDNTSVLGQITFEVQ